MADEIKIIVQNKQRKNINEVKAKRPRKFELLIKFIIDKIKGLPQYYTIYISQNGKEIAIESDEQYQIYIKNKVIYILERDMIDYAPTLIKKDEVHFEETITNIDENLEKENMKNSNKINEAPNESSKYIDDQFIDNLSDILKKILIRFKEVDSLLPENNEKLIDLVNKLEPNSLTVQINNISGIILEELKIIEDYIKSKVPKKGLEKKEKSNLILPIILPNIPYSCIPKIQIKLYPDISFEKIGKK